MKLRRLTLLVFCILSFILFSSFYVFSVKTLNKTIREIEIEDANTDLKRAIFLLETDLEGMGRMVEDWAVWDDTYDFISSVDQKFITANITEQVFENLKINIMLFADSQGEIVFEKEFNIEENTSVSKRVLEYLPSLAHISQMNSNAIGDIFLSPEGPMLLAASPILTSQGEGPSRGTLVMGRFLDSKEIQHLSHRSQLSLSLHDVHDDSAHNLDGLIFSDGSLNIKALDQDMLSVTTILTNVNDEPVLLLEARIPRNIHQIGLHTTRNFLLFALTSGIVFTLSVTVILEKKVLSRLKQLSAEIVAIGESGNFRGRLRTLNRKDEINTISEEVNAMLTKLERLYIQLDEEMDKARQVHDRTLPKSIPSIQGVSFSAHYQPAQKLGGDFYDVIQADNKLIIYLSDVSGHGLDGAMLSVFVKEAIDSYASLKPEEIYPHKILQHLHLQFRKERYPEEYFICIFLAVLDLESMELTYSGAGFQDTPLVRLGNGKKIKLASKGLFITSYLPQNMMEFHEDSIFLTPGTTILFNTDGLTEQNNQGAYYMDRLPNVFYGNAHLRPQMIAQAVTDDFRNFNNGSLQGKDDITFLILQVEPDKKETHHFELFSDLGELKGLQDVVVSEVLPGFKEVDVFIICLFELVANAIEHGNKFNPDKYVSVEISIVDGCIQTIVQDQGEGFPWQKKIDRPLDLEGKEDRGRGIAMTKICCDRLLYNERGNRVTFTVTT